MKIKATFAALALTASGAWAADEVTLQLKWVTQAQFAGYYVALDKGFYEEEDLDVTINKFDGQNWEANAGALAHKSND